MSEIVSSLGVRYLACVTVYQVPGTAGPCAGVQVAPIRYLVLYKYSSSTSTCTGVKILVALVSLILVSRQQFSNNIHDSRRELNKVKLPAVPLSNREKSRRAFYRENIFTVIKKVHGTIQGTKCKFEVQVPSPQLNK